MEAGLILIILGIAVAMMLNLAIGLIMVIVGSVLVVAR